jgi:hypothetical protein
MVKGVNGAANHFPQKAIKTVKHVRLAAHVKIPLDGGESLKNRAEKLNPKNDEISSLFEERAYKKRL